jgi:hypothetical protein
MVVGVVNNRTILTHPWLMLRLYGLKVYGRCWRAIFQRDRHTFLELLSFKG